jgi:hypothetical protein
MTANDSSEKHEHRKSGGMRGDGIFGGIYGMAFIGAAVYFIGHATSFWVGVLGFFKALFWPAVIMYQVLDILKM